jgi:hypothetical protein
MRILIQIPSTANTNGSYYWLFICLGTLEPMSREARINAMLPERRGPILSLLVRRGLHILPPRLPAILAACLHQLSRPALADFTASQAARELRPPDSDLGVLECLPREILLQVGCGEGG